MNVGEGEVHSNHHGNDLKSLKEVPMETSLQMQHDCVALPMQVSVSMMEFLN